MLFQEEIFQSCLKKTLDQAGERVRCNMPFPAWLEKKLKGMQLMETDFCAGLALFIDGLQDCVQALEEAEYHG